MAWNPKYALLLAFSTLITFLSGILINYSNGLTDEKKKNFQKKLWCFLSFTLNLAILFSFKYFNFAVENINFVLSHLKLQALKPSFDVVLPVGISFYIFQALSYTMDIYRGEIKAEKNIARYALFVSFFPQLVAGPIERSKNLIHQINDIHYFDYERVKSGILLMLYGFFQKVVIADRLAVFVDVVYKDYARFSGLWLMIASVFFAFQIYCDFGGYSNIARGAAQVFGFRLMLNFARPYFASSIQDFWRRWHISLSTWFRDYLYIPLGGSRCGRIKKYRNVFITFLLSGIWHGASWTFFIWGALHGLYQIIGQITKPLKDRLYSFLQIENNGALKFAKIITTFVLVDIAWIFFRAPSAKAAFAIVNTITSYFETYLYAGLCFLLLAIVLRIISIKKREINFFFFPALTGIVCGGGIFLAQILFKEKRQFALTKDMLEKEDFVFGIILIIFLLSFEYAQSSIENLRAWIFGQPLLIRWGFYYAIVLIIVMFGRYGGLTAASFIYFQF